MRKRRNMKQINVLRRTSSKMLVKIYQYRSQARLLQTKCTHFPDCKHAAGFLHLVHVLWTILNLNAGFHTNDRLGNATELNDGKATFLRSFVDWLDSWQHQKIPILENSVCDFSLMQYWSVYLAMSHEFDWDPSAWRISLFFDSKTAKWSSGEEIGPLSPDEWWALLNILQGLSLRKHWKSWA